MNKVHQGFFVYFVALFLLLFSAEVSHACSCMGTPAVDVALKRTPNLVVLKLRSVEEFVEGEDGFLNGYDQIKQSKLTVEKVFKGNLKIGQELNFAQGGGADCVWSFSKEGIGMEYLFYLGAQPTKDNTWEASTCSRSRSLKKAMQDLLYLENLAKVRRKTRLSGTMKQYIQASVIGEESSFNSLSRRRISLSGNGAKIELVTDENGFYEIYDLPAGKYKITPEKVTGYELSDEDGDTVEVKVNAKSHTEQDLIFRIDNEVSGKVFDSNGNLLELVCLELLPARGEKSKYFYQNKCTDEDGKFEFKEILAGSYFLVINPDGKITSKEPFGTFYFPSAANLEDAAVITIGAGDFRRNLIINAPDTKEVVIISGIVLYEDGNPVAKENVAFFKESAGEKAVYRPGNADAGDTTDSNGRFRVKVLKGQSGRLFALFTSFVGEYEDCPKLDQLLKAKGDSVHTIVAPPVKIEAINNLGGIELRFPFPSCKAAIID